VLLVTALGFSLRFLDLETVPPLVHGDEAYFGLDAIRVLQGQISNLFGTGFQDIPILSLVPQAVVMRWFGANLFGLRLSSVITGTLTIPLLYLLARLMVSRPVALFVAFLLAVSSWDIHFSRVGLDNVQVSPPQVMASYLLLRAMRTRRHLDFGLCGLATGLCIYLYYSARIVPVIVGVFLIYKLLTERPFLRQTGVQVAVLIRCLPDRRSTIGILPRPFPFLRGTHAGCVHREQPASCQRWRSERHSRRRAAQSGAADAARLQLLP